MGTQKSSPNFIVQGLQKDLRPAWEMYFKSNSKNFTNKVPNNGEGSSVPLKYIVIQSLKMPDWRKGKFLSRGCTRKQVWLIKT